MMCLILFAFNRHPRYPLIIAANRDEFYPRPAAPAHWWDDAPYLLAGKDLEAGGTWLGITKTGKIAALTNFRKADDPKPPNAPSRGKLAYQFLLSETPPQEYLDTLHPAACSYSGFNLLVGDMRGLFYYSNRLDLPAPHYKEITPGVYGLGNAFLDTSWPNINRGKYLMENLLAEPGQDLETGLFEILSNRETAPDDQLPDTGMGIQIERALSSLFIVTETYGTRSSTVITIDNNDRAAFTEKTHDTGAQTEKRFTFQILRD